MNVPNNNLRVRVWDLGPKAPKVPERPVMPTGLKVGSAEEVMAESDFKAAVSTYERERDDFARLKRDYDRWQALYAGPYQIEMWSVNAQEALGRDPDRYVYKLPKHAKPGQYHVDQEARRLEEAAEQQAVRNLDPQFGLKGAAA